MNDPAEPGFPRIYVPDHEPKAEPFPRLFILVWALILLFSLVAWAWVVCHLATWALEFKHRLF